MTKIPAPSDLADKFVLRMPEGMRERVTEAAKGNSRSMNAEIVHRLEKSLSDDFDKEAFANGLAASFIEAAVKATRSVLPASPDDSGPDYKELYFEKGLLAWMRSQRVFMSEADAYEKMFFQEHGRFESPRLERLRLGSSSIVENVVDKAYKSECYAKQKSFERGDLESKSLERHPAEVSKTLDDNLAAREDVRKSFSRATKDEGIEALREQLLSLEARLQEMK